MDASGLLPQTVSNLAARAGELLADCAVKDAAIAELRQQIQRLEKELDDLTAPE